MNRFFLCVVAVFITTNSVRADLSYNSIKNSISPGYISEIEFMAAAQEFAAAQNQYDDSMPADISYLFDLAVDVRNGQMVQAAGAMPLTSCGGFVGFVEDMRQESISSSVDIRKLYRVIAIAFLEIKGALITYNIPSSVWMEELDALEIQLIRVSPVN